MLLYRHFFTGLRFPSLIIESCWVSNGFIPVKSWVSLNYQFILRTVGIFPQHRVFKWTELNNVWIYVRWFKLIQFFNLDFTPFRTAWPHCRRWTRLDSVNGCSTARRWRIKASFLPTPTVRYIRLRDNQLTQPPQTPPRMKSVSTFPAVWSKPCQHGAIR